MIGYGVDYKIQLINNNIMANKYYDGSEKESKKGKKVQTGKSVGRKIVEVGGSLLTIALTVLGASKGRDKWKNMV